ncbi:molybdate ABC transporter substrate-binding protein [Marinobacter fonticola]|uniref:molybdate ABC transporter substrate-binding protein n=1 Tax=Marinobacter fonticola TaxID=2603215 RepID=UPI0011E7AA11|nr:molybdate ABC transporter substrate-binding protein [Marinobacter fonticola]
MPGRHRPLTASQTRLLPALVLILALFSLPSLPAFAEPHFRVFAAASLTDAMDAAIAQYEKDHEADITAVYAASSILARQIANGAPADLYVSANARWMNWLGEQGIRLQARTDLFHNRLALIASRPAAIDRFSPGSGAPIASLLAPGERLAVGDPAHVPAGIYTREALETLGEWSTLQSRLARSDNVRAALALVERGETPLGIVYQSDALASKAIKTLGLFPQRTHPPITYPVAIVSPDAGDAVKAFRKWLVTEQAQSIFQRFGFTPVEQQVQ